MGGFSTDKLDLKHVNFTLGFMISRPLIPSHGIGLRTGLRYFQTDNSFEISQTEVTLTDLNMEDQRETNSNTSKFNFLEVPLELTWNLNAWKRLGFFGGPTFEYLINANGTTVTEQFSNGSSFGSTFTGTPSGFRKFNLGATLGVEYKLTHRFSVGGLYNRAILKGFSFESELANVSTNSTIDGEIHFQNVRMYCGYKF